MNTYLTTNFLRSEFACAGNHCCGHSSPIDLTLVQNLQLLRDFMCEDQHADIRLHVTSGFRCLTHNATIPNASPTSYHTFGLAADILIPTGLSPLQMLAYIRLTEIAEERRLFHGIILHDTFIHLDRGDRHLLLDSRTNKALEPITEPLKSAKVIGPPL